VLAAEHDQQVADHGRLALFVQVHDVALGQLVEAIPPCRLRLRRCAGARR
jgi:hypothetical protein